MDSLMIGTLPATKTVFYPEIKKKHLPEVISNKFYIPEFKEIIDAEFKMPLKYFGPNPYLEFVGNSHIQWALNYGLIPNNKLAIKQLELAKFDLMCAYCFRYEGLEYLLFAIDFLTYLFIYDDYADNIRDEIGINPDKVKKFNDNVLKVLFEDKLPDQTIPLENALYNLKNRTLKYSQNPIHIFLEFKNTLNALEKEVMNRKNKYIPDLEEYIKIREFTAAVYLLFEIGYFTSEIVINDTLRNNELIKKMLRHANKYIAVSNDLISFKKEYLSELTENYVYILYKRYNMSLKEAIYYTIYFLNEEFKKYEDTVKAIREQNYFNDPNILKQIEIVDHWIRGNIDWSMNTARYKY